MLLKVSVSGWDRKPILQPDGAVSKLCILSFQPSTLPAFHFILQQTLTLTLNSQRILLVTTPFSLLIMESPSSTKNTPVSTQSPNMEAPTQVKRKRTPLASPGAQLPNEAASNNMTIPAQGSDSEGPPKKQRTPLPSGRANDPEAMGGADGNNSPRDDQAGDQVSSPAKQKVKCPHCDKFFSPKGMQRHINAKHVDVDGGDEEDDGTNIDPPKVAKKQEKVECQICRLAVLTYNMKRHVRVKHSDIWDDKLTLDEMFLNADLVGLIPDQGSMGDGPGPAHGHPDILDAIQDDLPADIRADDPIRQLGRNWTGPPADNDGDEGRGPGEIDVHPEDDNDRRRIYDGGKDGDASERANTGQVTEVKKSGWTAFQRK